MNNELVCIVTKAEASALRSTLPLAHFLSGHGYEIEYVGLFDAKAKNFIRDQGFHVKCFRNYPENLATEAGRSELTLREKYRSLSSWEGQVIQECYLHYQKTPPVLVLFEILNTSWVAPFVRLGVPLVAFSITLAAPFNTCIPSVHSHLVPSKKSGIPDAVRLLVNWTYRYKNYVFSKMLFRLKLRLLFWNARIPAVNYKRIFRNAGYKIKWGDYADNGFRINVPTLYLCPKEFDFPRGSKLGNRIYAGTSVQINRKEDLFDWSKIDCRRKNIYSTLGSLSEFYEEKYRRNFYRALIEAMRSENGYNLILQVGNRADLEGIDLPENIYVYDWVPHMEVFNNIQLIICHAGLGTLREAICHGVPSVVLPWGGDQPGNASRVVYHNLGIRVDFYTVTSAEIKASIRRIEEDLSIRHSVKRFQRSFRKSEEFPLKIDFFESLMKRTERPTLEFPNSYTLKS
jgi:zeaxanthin glucosyltransferase